MNYGRLFVYNNIGFREIKMIIPVYDSSEEEIGSSTRVPRPSTIKPSISSSSGTPYIIPEISVKLADGGFFKGIDVDFWLMLGSIFVGVWLGFRALEIMKGNYPYPWICFCQTLRCIVMNTQRQLRRLNQTKTKTRGSFDSTYKGGSAKHLSN